jgi:hypothetical protein
MRYIPILCLSLTGCGAIDVMPKSEPTPSLSQPQFPASTFALTNNPNGPEARMLRAAKRYCQAPQTTTIQHGSGYGIHGNWFLDFACPASAPSKEKPPNLADGG